MRGTGAAAGPAVAEGPGIGVDVATEIVAGRALADDRELDLTRRCAITAGVGAVHTAIGHPHVRLRHRSAAPRLRHALDDHGAGVGLLAGRIADGAGSGVGTGIGERMENALSARGAAVAEDPRKR